MYMRMMPAALLFVASAPAMALEPPCAPFDDYDEYLHYEVSYLVFGIGTLEMFYAHRDCEAGGCGAIIMETFPGIDFLRVYTEYFSEIDADGYFRTSHTWDDKGDEWGYAVTERNPETNRIVHRTGIADERFGESTQQHDYQVVAADTPTHDAVSLLRHIRNGIADEEHIHAELFDGGSIEIVPVSVVSRDESIELDVFDEPQPTTKVEIDLDFEAIHGLRDLLTVHFAQDERNTPLYVEARIIIGHVRIELTDYERR